MANASTALVALADPTRRAIFERVARRPQAVGTLAENFPISRPAVSQHLKVLQDASLVTHRAEGTRHIYYIDPQGLAAMRAWIDRFWDGALHAFKSELESEQGKPR